MENLLFVVIFVFIGMVVGAKFIVGILRIFPFFTLFSYGGQRSSNNASNKQSSEGGGAIGWTMIFVFLISFLLMFVYFEDTPDEGEDAVTQTEKEVNPSPRSDRRVPDRLDLNDPNTQYDYPLIKVENRAHRPAGGTQVDEFSNPVSRIDRAGEPGRLVASLNKQEALPSVPPSTLYLQLGSFGVHAYALEEAERMKNRLNRDVYLSIIQKNGNLTYKILVGPFPLRSDAMQFKKRSQLKKGFPVDVEGWELQQR